MTRYIPGIVSSNNMGSIGSHLVGEIVGNKSGCRGNGSLKKKKGKVFWNFSFKNTYTQSCFRQLEDLVRYGRGLVKWQ